MLFVLTSSVWRGPSTTSTSSTRSSHKAAMLRLFAALLLPALVLAYPGKAPWRDAASVFADGEPVPGLPAGFVYGFQIPILVNTHDAGRGKGGALLAFAQAYVLHESNRSALGGGAAAGDGNDGWIDLVLRRSVDGGSTWDRHSPWSSATQRSGPGAPPPAAPTTRASSRRRWWTPWRKRCCCSPRWITGTCGCRSRRTTGRPGRRPPR